MGNKPPKGALVGLSLVISMLPEEMLLEQLQDALTAYKLNPNSSTKQELQAGLAGVMMKLDMTGKNPLEVMKEFSKKENQMDILDTLNGEKNMN